MATTFERAARAGKERGQSPSDVPLRRAGKERGQSPSDVPLRRAGKERGQSPSDVPLRRAGKERGQSPSDVPLRRAGKERGQSPSDVPLRRAGKERGQSPSDVPLRRAGKERGQSPSDVPLRRAGKERGQSPSDVPLRRAGKERGQSPSDVPLRRAGKERGQSPSDVPLRRAGKERGQSPSDVPLRRAGKERGQSPSDVPLRRAGKERGQSPSDVPLRRAGKERGQSPSDVPLRRAGKERGQSPSDVPLRRAGKERGQSPSDVPLRRAGKERGQSPSDVPLRRAGWSNWAGTATANPSRTVWPGSVAELQDAVATAPGRVKAVGSGHSFTPIAVTDGLLVHLDRLSGLVDVDHERGTATLLGGTTIAAANELLAEQGLALSNLGDIDAQTVAGAIATGTHGTGERFTGLAAMVTALDLVGADGTLHHLTGGAEFDAARVGLGALGVITAVTFRCEPSFLLRAVERPAGLEATLDGFDDWVGGHDHAEFYWFPHTRRVLTKTNDRVEGPARPLHRARAWFDDELMSNTVFERANRIATRAPAVIPPLNRLSARALSAREYVDTSYRVFCSPRRVVFRETEFAIPRAALPTVLAEAQAWLDRTGERVAFPVEVRVAAADDVWLSTGHGRSNVYVAFHQYARRDHTRWFAAVEAVLREVGGRPHWGKLHTLTAPDLAALYPRFADFLAVRDRLDPDRRFANAHLERVLGP